MRINYFGNNVKARGIMIGIIGLAMLGWNAWTYLSKSSYDRVSIIIGLLFCLIGAVMIKVGK
jgi:hypothetical protein